MKRTFTLRTVLLLLLIAPAFHLKAQNPGKDTIKRDSITKRDSTVKKDSTLKKDTTQVTVKRPETVFLEVGGPGLALTANYDSRFGKRRDKWGYRVGAGYYNTGSNWVASVPLQINYLYGLGSKKGSSFLEFGAGTTFVRSEGSNRGSFFEFDNVTGFIGTGTIGYRYQQNKGGLNLRIGFVPVLYDDGFLAEGGFSIGYTFKK